MKRLIYFILICVSFVGNCCDNTNLKIYSKWKIDYILKTYNVCALNNKEANSYIGKKYIVCPNFVEKDNRKYLNLKFDISKIFADEFLSDERVSFDELGINSDYAYLINIYSLKSKLILTLITDNKNIYIINIKGVYFKLKRLNDYSCK